MRQNPKLVGNNDSEGPEGPEYRVRMTPRQVQHAEDLVWLPEMTSEGYWLRFEGRDLIGDKESLLKIAEFYEQDGEGFGTDSSGPWRRPLREAARRIRIGLWLDPDEVAAEVRRKFAASMAKLNRPPVDENPGRSPLSMAKRVFDECFDTMVERFPDFGDLELHEDERAGADNGAGSERQFGYCKDGYPILIAFAAKIESLPLHNIRGLMRHEYGHALDYRYGKKMLEQRLGVRLPDGVERRADSIAKAVFGDTIKYDDRLIQCVSCKGISPRPRRLGP